MTVPRAPQLITLPITLRLFSCVIVLFLALVVGRLEARQQDSPTVDDHDILEAVEQEFQFQDGLSANNIDVQVNEGVVTLSGSANTLLDKRRAARVIGWLRDVRAVVNQIQVPASGRDDEQVLTDVKETLQDTAIDTSNIQFEVTDGVVTISGQADSFEQGQLLDDSVSGIRGVRDVELDIQIVNQSDRPDSEIDTEIRRRYQLSPYLAEGRMNIKVDGGAVSLSGNVGSVNEKSLAKTLAWVAGVKEVDATDLEINPSQRSERRRDKFTVLRSDLQLQEAVSDALLYDPRVNGETIRVSVSNAAVSLFGNVRSLSAKQAATQDAENTLGVRRVRNYLKVKDPYWPGDRELTERVQSALNRDSHLAPFDLQASSHFGTVYLRGEVNHHFERRRAEKVIANVAGVLDLVNRITVDAPWQSKADEEIVEDFTRRLRWSPSLDDESIDVSVDDGVLELRGTVDTWHERRAVAELALLAGAKRVKNFLQTRSGTLQNDSSTSSTAS